MWKLTYANSLPFSWLVKTPLVEKYRWLQNHPPSLFEWHFRDTFCQFFYLLVFNFSIQTFQFHMLQTLALIGRRWLSMVDWQKTESRPLLSSPQNTIFWLNFQQPISFGHIDCKWCQVCRCMLPQNSHLCTLAVFSIMRAQDIIIGHSPFCYCKRTRITIFGADGKTCFFPFFIHTWL